MAKNTRSPLAPLVGDQVRAARDAAGLSQAALSELVGATQSYLAQVETGRQGLSVDALVRLADALGCEVRDLLPTMERIRAELGDISAALKRRA